MTAISYRPDIDGLRAVAVLSVILFHAGVPGFPGGFVGVDVFFVISGYLITSLILKDLQAGTFSFAGFWERRARRILPALGLVVAATLAAGWFLLLPQDFAALGKQVATQAAFGSNILFYKEAGYFDTESHLKPLLHTWSLAVEEQFYIFFPIAAVFVWRKFPAFFTRFLILSAVISFVLCAVMMEINPNLAFYMLPFRGWELLIGAVLAARPVTVPQRYRDILSVAGMAAILIPVFFYNGNTQFPGWAALPPVFGAAAVIAAGQGAFINRGLSWRPVVFIGLVSYSWYLWHWPVILFAKYHPLLTFDGKIALGCVSASFLLAVLSWRFVERPFRKFEWMPTRRGISAGAFSLLFCMMTAGLVFFLTNGLPSRLDRQVAQYAFGIKDDNPRRKECDKTDVPDIEKDKVCQTNPAAGEGTFMVWGDSHADAAAPVFYTLSEKYGRNGYVATHHGCPPILGYKRKDWHSQECSEFNQAVFDFIERRGVKTVFLIGNWMAWLRGGESVLPNPDWDRVEAAHENITAKAIQRTADRLAARGVKVYAMLDVPTQGFDVPRVLAKEALYGTALEKTPMTRAQHQNAEKEAGVDAFKSHAVHMNFLDPLPFLCPGEVCRYEADGYSLYYNPGHLSTHGAALLEPLFEGHFRTD
jgi:peptidoglycan/LPS O-acetylase OafA/YrhL